MYVLSYLLNYSITIASYCFPVYSMQFLTLLHYQIKLVIVSFSFLQAYLSLQCCLTSLISFYKAVMKALQRNLGLIRASLLPLELAEAWRAPGTFPRSEGMAAAGAESKISCPGCCPGLGMMAEQRGHPQSLGTAPSSLQALQFHLLPSCFYLFLFFPLFGKLSELQFFIHRCRNDLSPLFVESQISHRQKISPLICSTSDRTKATEKKSVSSVLSIKYSKERRSCGFIQLKGGLLRFVDLASVINKPKTSAIIEAISTFTSHETPFPLAPLGILRSPKKAELAFFLAGSVNPACQRC